MGVEEYEAMELWIRAFERVLVPMAIVALSVCAIVYLIYAVRSEKMMAQEKEIKRLRKKLDMVCQAQCDSAYELNGYDDAIRDERARTEQHKDRANSMAEIAEAYRRKAEAT